MSMRRWAAAACVVVVAMAAAAADTDTDTKPSKPETSRNLGYATYEEKVGRVDVILSSYGASFEGSDKYFMLQVAVAVIGDGKELSFSDKSFTLLDSDGNLYAMAPPEELAKEIELLNFATELQNTQPLQTDRDFANLRRIQSDFYAEDDLRWTRVNINLDEYFDDVVFFPKPKSGFTGVFTLNVLTQDMKEPVEVRFEIPPAKEKKKKDEKNK